MIDKEGLRDMRFPSPPYYVSAECKLIPKAVDEELTRLDAETSRLASRVQELEEALRGLVDGLKVVHADPQYESVWTVAQLHRGAYTGPKYVEQLEQAERALAGKKETNG